ncbi:unnamed protein product [Somion occarium]|uniref:C3H1-type domain-containing protein n=1 Tax=Somion occarium TaxID=3059160 RepID=A0ABP1CVX5_9APHY
MPVSDTKQDESFHDSGSHEPDSREKDKDRDRSGKGKSSAKTKDLSHVPCKFFRVGSCTAGSSCPFSHNVLEPGQQKEVCAWFVKGNCKFGHKCALAHILPGQSMSMDRKNKKAAQAAANAAGGGGSGGNRDREGRGGGRGGKNAPRGEQRDGSRNALLSGSTAPTRTLSSSRGSMPMPMKATLSPSAPAPPVKDTDFASFGLPDEANKLSSPPAQGKPLAEGSPEGNSDETRDETETVAVAEESEPGKTSPSPLPTSVPSARRSGLSQTDSPSAVDFGPIGSPPQASPAGIARVNGFSPGTSPHHLSTSPFSAPGTQTSFLIREQLDISNDLKTKSGLSASLGAMVSWGSDLKSSRRNGLGIGGSSLSNDIVVEDEDLEEFIPGSLSDLLTPEERSRRFSRTNSGNRPHMAVVDSTRDAIGPGHHHTSITGATPTDSAHHRYSRSVPAPSLLQDIRSIWTDTNTAIPGSPDTLGAGTPITGGGLGNGTPSSFQSGSGFGSRLDEMLAPTNASAAFLPGLHHYIKNKTAGGLSATGGMSSLYPHGPTGSATITPSGGAYNTAGLNGMALSPPRANPAHRSAFGEAPGSSETYLSATRHLSNLGRTAVGPDPHLPHLNHDRRNALSPSALALQAHAPGQSLPQGLAAGYSRIHALPPPVIASPNGSTAAFSPGRSLTTGAGFSPSRKALGHSSGLSEEWRNMSSGTATTGSGLGGLDSMFSRLSYSAAASRPSAAPPGIVARNPSGRGHNPQGPLSPLSGPVLTGDDDDLFSMDG